jgi:hypothetical protein
MDRNQAMLKVRELTDGSLRQSELALDEVDFVGYYVIAKARAIIIRERTHTYIAHYFVTDRSVDLAARTGLGEQPTWVENARPNQDPNSPLFIP